MRGAPDRPVTENGREVVRQPAPMERSVQLIVVGGLVLLAGLWATHLLAWASPGWYGGAVLALLGAAALGQGIRREVTVNPFWR